MLQVGLTGNIASGKSHASSVFAELGAHVIDADVIAHELFSPGTATYAKVVQAFGNRILAPDGTINRKVLGDIVFRQTEQRLLLNALVHPDVLTEVMRRTFELENKGFDGIVIVDAALMVESGFYKMQDRLIVVTCDPALQLARVMNRCGVSAEDARLRITAQMPVAEKLRLADYTIDTSGTYASTREQIERIYRELILQERVRRDADAQGG
ncbi:MAG: dephospho-CoA kinase [Acidobacteriia bacterium]|nr:dephospho-CoA kinase [Terriglobia bacterium]